MTLDQLIDSFVEVERLTEYLDEELVIPGLNRPITRRQLMNSALVAAPGYLSDYALKKLRAAGLFVYESPWMHGMMLVDRSVLVGKKGSP